MAPRYPRPLRPQPLQVGKFTLQPLPMPMPIGILDEFEEQNSRPTFTMEDEKNMMAMGISLDLSRDIGAHS